MKRQYEERLLHRSSRQIYVTFHVTHVSGDFTGIATIGELRDFDSTCLYRTGKPMLIIHSMYSNISIGKNFCKYKSRRYKGLHPHRHAADNHEYPDHQRKLLRGARKVRIQKISHAWSIAWQVRRYTLMCSSCKKPSTHSAMKIATKSLGRSGVGYTTEEEVASVPWAEFYSANTAISSFSSLRKRTAVKPLTWTTTIVALRFIASPKIGLYFKLLNIVLNKAGRTVQKT